MSAHTPDAGYDASPSYSSRLWTVFPDAGANAALIARAPEIPELAAELEHVAAFMGFSDLCLPPRDRPKYRADIEAAVRAALRKAGRLP